MGHTMLSKFVTSVYAFPDVSLSLHNFRGVNEVPYASAILLSGFATSGMRRSGRWAFASLILCSVEVGFEVKIES